MKYLNGIGQYLALFACFILTSCVGAGLGGSDASTTTEGGTGTGIDNSQGSVPVGRGRILRANPIVLSGNSKLSQSVNLNTLLSSSTVPITTKQTLSGDCEAPQTGLGTIQNCYKVLEGPNALPLVNSSSKWGYNANSREFLQVHTFGHSKMLFDQYHSLLEQSVGDDVYYSTLFDTSLPSGGALFSSLGHWKKLPNGQSQALSIYSHCDLTGSENNAYFDRSTYEICMGRDNLYTNVYFAQDPSVIYHELGHSLVNLMMNIRSNTSNSIVQSQLSHLFYDEANAINEGIADWMSYFMTNRTRIGEWALGRFLDASRPLTESDPLHVATVGDFDGGSLSYPTYLNYDVRSASVPVEDVHYAGQIMTHYLVALTKNIDNKCGFNDIDKSQAQVFRILIETLSELGDMSARGSDSAQNYFGTSEYEYKVNLSPTHAYEWNRINNPINYRKFSQTLAKYQKELLVDSASDSSVCPGTYCPCPNRVYTTDDIESLLDKYGLLLFETYNENGNSALRSISSVPGSSPLGHSGTNKLVSPANRVQSQLINKEHIKIDDRAGQSTAYVFDDRSDMLSVLDGAGLGAFLSDQIDSQLIHNNGNGKISPGEFLGVLPNLYNDSTSTMAGVQLLANDWDHFKDDKPCNNLGDNFPFSSEGAADISTNEGTPGACDYTTRENGDETEEDLAPVCFVQTEESGSLVWVSQEKFRDKMNLDKSKCLSPSTTNSSNQTVYNTSNCFIRAFKDRDHAYYSKINPKSNWVDTLKDDTGTPQFSVSNLIFFEVSPWIPPGTQFNCRFRARFTNCKDCFHDSLNSNDDYLDYEYSGARPFKIINFQFRVID